MVAIQSNQSEADDVSLSPTVVTANSKRTYKSAKSVVSSKSKNGKSVGSQKTDRSFKSTFSMRSKASNKPPEMIVQQDSGPLAESAKSTKFASTIQSFEKDAGSVAKSVKSSVSVKPNAKEDGSVTESVVKSTKSSTSVKSLANDGLYVANKSAESGGKEDAPLTAASFPLTKSLTSVDSLANNEGSITSSVALTKTIQPAKSDVQEDVSVAEASLTSAKSTKSTNTVAQEEGSVSASVKSDAEVESITSAKSVEKEAGSVSKRSVRSTRSSKSQKSIAGCDKSVAVSVNSDHTTKSTADSSVAAISTTNSESVQSINSKISRQVVTSFAKNDSKSSVRSTKSSKSLRSLAGCNRSVAASVNSTKTSKSAANNSVAPISTKNSESVQSIKSKISQRVVTSLPKGDMSVSTSVKQTKSALSAHSVQSAANKDGSVLAVSEYSVKTAALSDGSGSVSDKSATKPVSVDSNICKDDDMSILTSASEAKVRRLLRLYGFGAGMRMYRKSIELVHRGGHAELDKSEEQRHEIDEPSIGLAKRDIIGQIEGREELVADICGEGATNGDVDDEACSLTSTVSNTSPMVKEDEASSVFNGGSLESKSWASVDDASKRSNVKKDGVSSRASTGSGKSANVKQEDALSASNGGFELSKSMEANDEALVERSSVKEQASECEPMVEIDSEKTFDEKPIMTQSCAESTEQRTSFIIQSACDFFWSMEEAAKNVFRRCENLVTPEPENLLSQEEPSNTLDQMLGSICEANTSIDDGNIWEAQTSIDESIENVVKAEV